MSFFVKLFSKIYDTSLKTVSETNENVSENSLFVVATSGDTGSAVLSSFRNYCCLFSNDAYINFTFFEKIFINF